MKKQLLLMTMSAFLGAILAIILIGPTPLEAHNKRISGLFEIFNSSKKRVAMMGPAQQQQGSIFLFNESGVNSHQMLTYGAGSEKGQAFYSMNDRNGKLRYLFRLHGPNDSPVLIMKDKSGYDKIVIGLKGANETPYIQFVDSKGQTRDLLAGQ